MIILFLGFCCKGPRYREGALKPGISPGNQGQLEGMIKNYSIINCVLLLQCLISGSNDKGKKYLKILLKKEPNNGFGQGHLGFVYKMELKYDEAVPLLYAGIRGDDERSKHSRFYYHLGDALMRLNRTNEVQLLFAVFLLASYSAAHTVLLFLLLLPIFLILVGDRKSCCVNSVSTTVNSHLNAYICVALK